MASSTQSTALNEKEMTHTCLHPIKGAHWSMYSHPCSQAGQTAVEVLGLVKLKPWEHVNLWEQSAPRRTCSLSEAQPRLFPASSVFYYPSPGTAPLYSRPLWERKAPEPRLIPPLRTHAPPDLLRLSLYLHRQLMLYPKKCSMEKKCKARGQNSDWFKGYLKLVMCFLCFY